jgi:hypothetical protein
MGCLVLELQEDALNNKISVSDLLRKALAVSRKLGVTHIEEWLKNELNGYPQESVIPDYREVYGQFQVWNPYHGWQPLNFANSDMAEALSKNKISQPVGELISLVSKNNRIQMTLPPQVVNSLLKSMQVPLQPALHVASSTVIRILDIVRNNILDFALQLEQEGVLGEKMSFSNDEKKTASQIIYNITNNIGNMQHSQIQQHSSGIQNLTSGNDLKELLSFLQRLREEAKHLKLDSAFEKELFAEISTVESQANSPRPKPSILSESLKTIRTILEGAAGNVFASGLLTEMMKFF